MNFAVHETTYLSNFYAEAASATYNENALTPTLTWYKNVGTADAEIVNLTAGTDYEITAVYKAKWEEDGSEYVPVGDSIGTSATEAGTYLVDIQGKGNYSGNQRIVWTINPADIATLTGVNTTYNGDPQTLFSGTPTQGTMFSLTEPRVDYDAEMQRVGALADQANAASLSYQNQEQLTPASYYYNVSSALINYRDAIRSLKENDESDASHSFAYALDYVNGIESHGVTANDEATLYIQTYIKGKKFKDFKARFNAADPVWKSADEITAIDAGTYTVWYKYGGDNSANYTDKVKSFTATINKAAPSFTTAPAIVNNGTLNYTGEKQALITEGTVDEKMGTMEYAVGVPVSYDVIRRNTWEPLESVEVGKVYAPDGEVGVVFPVGYKNLNLTRNGDSTVYQPNSSSGFNFCKDNGNYILWHNEDYVHLGTNDVGFLITSLDDNNKTIYAEVVDLSGNTVPDNLEWSPDVPERTDIGEYNVYYRVVSNENSGNYNEGNL